MKSTNGKFGKSYGNDISEGKISLPVVYALEHLSPIDRDGLIQILKRHTRNKKYIRKAINLINSTGAITNSVSFAKNLVSKSYKRLEKDYSNIYDLGKIKEISAYFVNRDY